MISYPSHSENIVALKRIEGQIRGIQKMIENKEYCVDILNQIQAVISALARVEDKILERHFENCLSSALAGKSTVAKKQKLDEILQLINRFRKV
ncbi:MAG: metal-sensitive transcriptional regulator [Candidatus Omnitrophota bacterium]